MKDKFGNYFGTGDIVLYNNCVVGKVLDVYYPVMSPVPTTNGYIGSFASRVKRGVLVENSKGQRTQTQANKIVRIGGLPQDILDKFK